MEKINPNEPRQIEKTGAKDTTKKNNTFSIPTEKSSFQEIMDSSSKKLDGISLKLKNSIHNASSVNTEEIIGEVSQARVLLDEITHTFHQIQTNKDLVTKENQKSAEQPEQTKVDEKIEIYQKTTGINNKPKKT